MCVKWKCPRLKYLMHNSETIRFFMSVLTLYIVISNYVLYNQYTAILGFRFEKKVH